MSIALDFGDNCIRGYLDTSRPLTGWLLAKDKIENVWIQCGARMAPCSYGLPRPDVARKNKGADSYVNCGFREDIACLYPSDAEVIVLAKIANQGILACKPVKIAPLDSKMLDPKAPLSNEYAHESWLKRLSERFNKPGLDILEIGARRVTGANLKPSFDRANYKGFDIAPGQNVDVVGDAHYLSRYFEQKFDLIFSSAVFEHFAMPWVVAEEIAKLLKIGGYVFVETHYSFSSHERPWHFFQFSEKALEALFCEGHGIQKEASGVSTPIIGFFSSLAAPYLHGRPVSGLYCHSQFLGKKICDTAGWKWDREILENIYGNSSYPHRQESNK